MHSNSLRLPWIRNPGPRPGGRTRGCVCLSSSFLPGTHRVYSNSPRKALIGWSHLTREQRAARDDNHPRVLRCLIPGLPSRPEEVAGTAQPSLWRLPVLLLPGSSHACPLDCAWALDLCAPSTRAVVFGKSLLTEVRQLDLMAAKDSGSPSSWRNILEYNAGHDPSSAYHKWISRAQKPTRSQATRQGAQRQEWSGELGDQALRVTEAGKEKTTPTRGGGSRGQS